MRQTAPKYLFISTTFSDYRLGTTVYTFQCSSECFTFFLSRECVRSSWLSEWLKFLVPFLLLLPSAVALLPLSNHIYRIREVHSRPRSKCRFFTSSMRVRNARMCVLRYLSQTRVKFPRCEERTNCVKLGKRKFDGLNHLFPTDIISEEFLRGNHSRPHIARLMSAAQSRFSQGKDRLTKERLSHCYYLRDNGNDVRI